jgi:hypothetical protein
MPRYHKFIHVLNNIPKVCILPDMPIYGLTFTCGPVGLPT